MPIVGRASTAKTMKRKDSTPSPLFRVLGGLAGLIVGGVVGAVILVLAMIFADESFGLRSIVPGVLVGAGVGLLLGLCYPWAIGRALGALLSGL